ncbi:MAG: L-threonylcarbamoyladenylate synthase [Litorimonas sp.]
MADNRPHNNIHDYNALDTVLARGGVAIVPTETVYGLAARPDNKASIDKIYALKGRNFNKPLALCVRWEKHYTNLVEWTDLAQALTQSFWPGPLTLVMPAKMPLRFDKRLYGQDGQARPTLALRCPQSSWSPYCQTMPLALTSANRSGQASATTFDAAYEVFGKDIDGAYRELDTAQGEPSTIIALDGRKATLLRMGAMQADDFAAFDMDWQF